MKKACMEVWGEKGNEGGYRDEKIDRIKDIGNIQDNFMYMFAMFDENNQRQVVEKLSGESRKAVRERMISGGNDEWVIAELGL